MVRDSEDGLVTSEFDRKKFLRLVVGAKRGASSAEMDWLSEKEGQLRKMEGRNR